MLLKFKSKRRRIPKAIALSIEHLKMILMQKRKKIRIMPSRFLPANTPIRLVRSEWRCLHELTEPNANVKKSVSS